MNLSYCIFNMVMERSKIIHHYEKISYDNDKRIRKNNK